jgi:hypothetical protein
MNVHFQWGDSMPTHVQKLKNGRLSKKSIIGEGDSSGRWEEEDLPNNDDIIVRVGLDYSEEMHWSKTLG